MFANSRGLFRNLSASLRHPAKPAPNLPVKTKLTGTVRTLLITLLWSLAGSIVVGLLPQAGQNAVVEALEEFTWGFAFFAVAYAAVYEELAFRAVLRPTRFGLGFGLGFWVWFWLINVGEVRLLERIFDAPFLVGFDTLITPFVFGLCGYLLLGYAPLRSKLVSLHRQSASFILWLSILAFAWVHALNFSDAVDNWYLAPLLTLPQLIIALSLSAVRLRYGFLYAVLLHGLNNAFGVLVAATLLRGVELGETTAGLTLVGIGLTLFTVVFLSSLALNFHAFLELYRTRSRPPGTS